jgi:hypothetical protein
LLRDVLDERIWTGTAAYRTPWECVLNAWSLKHEHILDWQTS